MKTLWKALFALALVVPLAAYVAGSLVASAADDPAPRPPIVIQDAGRSASPSENHSESPSASPSASDDVGAVEFDPDDLDDDSDDFGRDDDDHGDDHGGDRDDRGDDHSGPGGGGDDHSNGSGDDGGQGSDDG